MKKLLFTSLACTLMPLTLWADGWPANYGGVMLQGFYWDSFSDTRWTKLEAQADELSQYFSLIWVPQSGKCLNSGSMGYDPYYYFDQNSAFGTATELKSMIKDYLPDCLYYPLILRRHKKDFEAFKNLCAINGIIIPNEVELSYQRPRKNKRVLTVGVYDLLHKGHVELYRRAKGLGDYLIVAAQDSEYILKYKPNAKVLNSTEDRKYMIKSIRYVDEVITYTDVDKIVQDVDFDVFVTGPDQCHSGFQKAIQWCETHGKEHIVLARTDGVSSSELKTKIAEKIKKENGK